MILQRVARDFAKFARNAREQRQSLPSGPGLLRSLRYFQSWRRALAGATPLADGQPWITFAAIEHLKRFIRPGSRVFEYGSGGSTLFFLRLGATVVSVEHDSEWRRRVAEAIEREFGVSSEVLLVEPEPAAQSLFDCSSPDQYGSSDARYSGQSFESYVRTIDRFPDDSFDLVLIDGRARPACFRHALSKIRRDGWLVLDNSDLPHYAPAMKLAEPRFERTDLPGPIPYVPWFIQTSLWRRVR